MQVRLLGGSKHQKKMEVTKHTQTIFIEKQPRRIRWTPDYNMDTFIKRETEFYELTKMYKTKPISDVQFHVEVRIAYVKKGSVIKPETFWRLAFPYEEFVEWARVGTS